MSLRISNWTLADRLLKLTAQVKNKKIFLYYWLWLTFSFLAINKPFYCKHWSFFPVWLKSSCVFVCQCMTCAVTLGSRCFSSAVTLGQFQNRNQIKKTNHGSISNDLGFETFPSVQTREKPVRLNPSLGSELRPQAWRLPLATASALMLLPANWHAELLTLTRSRWCFIHGTIIDPSACSCRRDRAPQMKGPAELSFGFGLHHTFMRTQRAVTKTPPDALWRQHWWMQPSVQLL